MQPSYEELVNEIAVLKQAAKIHARYSIKQYRRVLQAVRELEREKRLLEQKVKERTKSLEREVQKSRQFAKELERVAKYDVLTQLPNRFYFQHYLAHMHERYHKFAEPFTIFFIDLDGFKHINDFYGHKAGDVVLQQVAGRLRKLIRKSDFVARLAGDEFVVVFASLDNEKILEQIAQGVLDTLKKPIRFEGKQLQIGASIGIYVYDGADLEDVLINADLAMYEAKHQGKGRYIFFEKGTKERFKSFFLTKKQLEEAYTRNEYINYLQPILSSRDHKIRGAEILLRWKRDGKIVPPGSFIEVLEEMDLIVDVTRWQFLSCGQCLERFSDLFLTFNITARVLESDMLHEAVGKLIERGVRTDQIHLELTESDFVKDVRRAQNILAAMHEEGVKIVLDDFGVGYSSLSYIRDFPIDTIKIDREFVNNIENSQKDRRLFYAIIEMAEALGADVIVEGVETKEQLELIPKEDFVYIQGFYFYPPMPKEQFRTIVQKERNANTL